MVSDHFKKSTIRAIHQNHPAIRFACCEWLVHPLLEAGVSPKSIDLHKIGEGSLYKGLVCVEPIPLVHDVPNCGWKLLFPCPGKGVERALYATDTGTMDGIEAKDYEYYLIEANHKKDEIAKRIAEKEANGEFAYERRAAATHLSQEQAMDWLSENMEAKSQYMFLHGHKEEQ